MGGTQLATFSVWLHRKSSKAKELKSSTLILQNLIQGYLLSNFLDRFTNDLVLNMIVVCLRPLTDMMTSGSDGTEATDRRFFETVFFGTSFPEGRRM